MRKYLLLLCLTIIGCGSQPQPGPNDDLARRIDALEQTSGAISSMVYSDFSTCPASGDTADALIRKICQVAQAATVETRVELKGELAAFAQSLQGQIDVINTNLSANQTDIDSINTQLTAINGSLVSLGNRMTSAENAIIALQNLTASINGTLSGAMIALDIGNENAAAGPLYESVLRRVDKKRFTGYVQAYAAYQTFGNNPLAATSGQAALVATLTAHGYLVGDRVELSGLIGSRGFANGHITGVFVVTAVTANTFTFSAAVNASSTGTVGGSTPGLVRKILGEGMGTLWATGDVSDVAVRVSNLGTKRYNFIIRRKLSDSTLGELCYSKSNNAATFATISAAPEDGNATIACK